MRALSHYSSGELNTINSSKTEKAQEHQGLQTVDKTILPE